MHIVDSTSGKYFLSFHTVFIADENVDWLEEFLVYYINLGFEQFYLYDNNGSEGRPWDPPWTNSTTNKFKLPITKKDPEKLSYILDKYHKYITYIKWTPRYRKNGNIHYYYRQAVFHFLGTWPCISKWCFFGDLDEFLFSSNNLDITTYLKDWTDSPTTKPCNYPVISLRQKSFKHRQLIKEKLITQNFECSNKKINHLKHIIKTSSAYGLSNMHHWHADGNSVPGFQVHGAEHYFTMPIEDWRLNHYNWVDKQDKVRTCPHCNAALSVPDKLDDIDDGMKRYSDLFQNELVD